MKKLMMMLLWLNFEQMTKNNKKNCHVFNCHNTFIINQK